MNGERSKYLGPDASWTFTGNGTTNNNLNSDFFFKLIIAEQRVEQLLALALLASSAVAIDGIGSAQPPTAGVVPSAVPTGEQVAAQLGQAWQGIQIGSNAIAFGNEATDSGRGLLLGNPHFPWHGSERFHQAHLQIPGVLDVTGVSLFGVPLVLIGYNKDLAWSHTVSSAWRFTPYQLTLVPGMPTSYVVDGVPEAMTPHALSVEALQSDGSLATVERTLYTTRWGPVFTSVPGLPLFPWLPAQAYALADANAANFRYVNHFLETNRATSTRELLQVLERNQGIPWVNTIAADRVGEAFYADISVTPNVPDDMALRCAGALGTATAQLLGLPILDGSRSACAWQIDDDAVQAGTIGPSNMPHLFRADYVTNSNDSYWLSNPQEPLEGYARIIGDERIERRMRMRTRLGLVMVQEHLASGSFSRQQMQDLLFNDRQHAAELWLDELIPFCQLTPVLLGSAGPVVTGEACDVLAAWDRSDRLDSPGAVLFRRFAQNLFITSVPSGSSANYLGFADAWNTPFDVNDPVHTPRGLNVANPHVEEALANAISDLQAADLPLDATLRTTQFEARGDESIPIHGGPGEMGVFNAITAPWVAGTGYPDIVHGSSFIQVVNFDDDDCPNARTILTYSQSANPASPHYADQTRLYSDSGWVPARFCESEIAGHVTETLTLSE